jgi:signal transduction histidine kinase
VIWSGSGQAAPADRAIGLRDADNVAVRQAGNVQRGWPAAWSPRVAGALAAVSVVCALGSLGLYAYNLSFAAGRVQYLYGDNLVVGMIFPLAGAFLVRRRPGNLVGWVLLAGCLVGINALAGQYAVAGLLGPHGRLPGAELAAWVGTWAWAPELAVLSLLPLLFPDGRLPSPRWRPLAWAILGCSGVLILAAMLAPIGPDASASHTLHNPLGQSPVFTGLLLVMVAVLGVVLIPLSVLALGLRMRRANSAERAQMQWLLFAGVVTLAFGVSASAVPKPWQEAFWAIGMAAIPAGIVIAVLRYQLLDIEVVLNRAVVYGLLTGLVLIGYLAAIAGVGQVAAQRTGLLAVAVLALLAAAARARVQRGVDRMLFGYRRDPYAVVDRVGQRLDLASGPIDALQQIASELRVALRLPSVAVLPDDSRLAVIATGAAVAGVRDLPVVVEGHQVALLRIGLRHQAERLRPEEQSVLADVSRRIGALVQAAGLINDLQRSRESLVAAREEERRRLRHDLHDGLGPELAGMALQLDSLMGQLDGQSAAAERVQVLRDRMRQTVAEVRHVVDNLRPPAIDELGLLDALRQHVAAYALTPAGSAGAAGISVEVAADELPALPAAVEVAAYRISAEAVANAVRHGRATVCTVAVSAAPGRLLVTIEDNGTGIDPQAVRGVGLQSMRDRAAELGGGLSVDTGSAGTTIRGWLPLQLR